MSKGRWAMLVAGLCLVVAAVVAACAAGTQATAPVQEVVQAQRFELVDAEGKVLGVLGVRQRMVELAFLDEEGKTLATLGVNPGHVPRLSLHDGDGRLRTLLVATGDDSSILLFSPRRDPREAGLWEEELRLDVLEEGSPCITLNDVKDGRRAVLRATGLQTTGARGAD